MNEIKAKASPDDDEGTKRHDESAGPAETKPRYPFPLMDTSHTFRADVTADNPQQHSQNQHRTRGQRFLDWICTITPGDIILGAVALLAVFIAIGQNTLIGQSNNTAVAALDKVTESNKVAKENTGYTKISADAVREALVLAKQGEETAKKTAEALAATAKATEDAASATKGVVEATNSVARENAKTAVATKAVAEENAKTAAATKAVAEENAKTAKASEKVADIAEQANKTSREQLRAYVTVVMEPRPPFLLTENGFAFEIRMRFKNSGATPAKKITVRTEEYFRRESDERVPNPSTLKALNGAGMTIGPGGEWPLFIGHVRSSNDTAPQNGGLACVLGRIEYVDVFGEKRFGVLPETWSMWYESL